MFKDFINTSGKLLLYIVFLLLPTIALLYFSIDKISNDFEFLNRNIYTEQAIIVLFAITAFTLHFYKVRTWVTALPLAVGIYGLNHYFNTISYGEFDAFYVEIKFKHYIILSVIGYLVGYCLSRFRYFPYLLSVVFIAMGVFFIPDLAIYDLDKILLYFLPILLYGFYAVYIREVLEDFENINFKRIIGLFLRVALFLGLLYFVYLLTNNWLSARFSQYKKEIAGALSKEGKGKGGGSDASKDKMLRQNPDGTFDINEMAKLDRRQNAVTGDFMKKLLFVTYLENFLPGTDNVPVPYYYVSHYLNRYDTIREQFVRDLQAPDADHFIPQPVQLPMLITYSDQKLLDKVTKYKARTTKEVLVYIDSLNPNQFTAPATAYSVEPIPVDPDFKDKYKFAYRAKSYVSYLNQAIFVYNVDHPVFDMFRKQRDEVLNEDFNYSKTDQKFLKYYTQVPKGGLYDSIATLAKSITKNAKTPAQKIDKIKKYFKSKDEAGKPKFKYTLEVMKPTEPNIPNNKMLSNFLFKTKKGYCTYYSSASLFMLRSLGVPTRFTTGFLIEDRSAGKNAGWYTVYGSQAHAWIQVYFPSYGWIDIDNTISSEEEQNTAPKPDGTPPVTIPKVYFSGHGKIISTDTAQKTVLISMKDMNFRNNEYTFNNPPELLIAIDKAKMFKNKELAKITDFKKDIEISAVVYANLFKNIKLPEEYGSGKAFVEALKKPLPVDEVHLKIEIPKPKEIKNTKVVEKPSIWPQIVLKIILSVIVSVLLLLLFSPIIVYSYYSYKMNSSRKLEQKTYYTHMFTLFLLNQLGLYRGAKTTLSYAKNVIEPKFKVEYVKFASLYSKLKYSNTPFSSEEEKFVFEFAKTIKKNIFSMISLKQKIKLFVNYIMLQKFFAMPEEESTEIN